MLTSPSHIHAGGEVPKATTFLKKKEEEEEKANGAPHYAWTPVKCPSVSSAPKIVMQKHWFEGAAAVVWEMGKRY